MILGGNAANPAKPRYWYKICTGDKNAFSAGIEEPLQSI